MLPDIIFRMHIASGYETMELATKTHDNQTSTQKTKFETLTACGNTV